MSDERAGRLAGLRVRIEAPNLGDDELDRLTRQLRSELRDSTDAERIDLVGSGSMPRGAKGADALQLGDLAVRLLPAAVPGLITVLRSWSGRHKQREIKVMVRVGERAVELEYPVGEMTRDDLLTLVAIVSGAPARNTSEG